MKLRELVSRLEEVARNNGDDFQGVLRITLGQRNSHPCIHFEETAERHTFLTTSFVDSIFELEVDASPQLINECCDGWGYKRPADYM